MPAVNEPTSAPCGQHKHHDNHHQVSHMMLGEKMKYLFPDTSLQGAISAGESVTASCIAHLALYMHGLQVYCFCRVEWVCGGIPLKSLSGSCNFTVTCKQWHIKNHCSYVEDNVALYGSNLLVSAFLEKIE